MSCIVSWDGHILFPQEIPPLFVIFFFWIGTVGSIAGIIHSAFTVLILMSKAQLKKIFASRRAFEAAGTWRGPFELSTVARRKERERPKKARTFSIAPDYINGDCTARCSAL